MKLQDVLANANLDFVKTKVKDTSVSSDCFYKANVPYYLFNEELKALKNLPKIPNQQFVKQIKMIQWPVLRRIFRSVICKIWLRAELSLKSFFERKAFEISGETIMRADDSRSLNL